MLAAYASWRRETLRERTINCFQSVSPGRLSRAAATGKEAEALTRRRRVVIEKLAALSRRTHGNERRRAESARSLRCTTSRPR